MLPASGLRLLYASRGSGTHRSSLLFLVRRLCLYPLQRGHDHEYTAADHRNLHRSSLSLRLNKGGRPPASAFACQKSGFATFPKELRPAAGTRRPLTADIWHTYRPRSVCSDAHVAGANGLDWIRACTPRAFPRLLCRLGHGRELCEAFSASWSGRPPFLGGVFLHTGAMVLSAAHRGLSPASKRRLSPSVSSRHIL